MFGHLSVLLYARTGKDECSCPWGHVHPADCIFSHSSSRRVAHSEESAALPTTGEYHTECGSFLLKPTSIKLTDDVNNLLFITILHGSSKQQARLSLLTDISAPMQQCDETRSSETLPTAALYRASPRCTLSASVRFSNEPRCQ